MGGYSLGGGSRRAGGREKPLKAETHRRKNTEEVRKGSYTEVRSNVGFWQRESSIKRSKTDPYYNIGSFLIA